MDNLAIGLLSLAGILVAIYAGLHVAIALAGVSILGVWALTGKFVLAMNFVALAATDSIAEYAFGVVPLFVLMGIAVSEAGFGRDTFAILSRGMRRWRAGLAVSTVLSNAVFAAITGISIASAAVFSKVAVPEMVRAGTSRAVAVGTVAGSSVLGMLIPPSLLLIVFAVLTDSSVGDLFLAGIGPGLLLATGFCLYLTLLERLKPGLFRQSVQAATASPSGASEPATAEDETPTILIVPVLALAGIVLGGIYSGQFTATEAGAIGAAVALALAFGLGRVDLRGAWRIATVTGHITAAVSFLIVGAAIYSRMLGFSGVPGFVTQWAIASDLGPTGFLVLFSCVLILLGTILDSTSILLITVPLAFPITQSLGVDPIHFGLVAVLAVEIGLLTPPLGLSVFVVQSTLRSEGVTLREVFAGAAPFAGIMVLTLIAVILVPQIATGLLGR